MMKRLALIILCLITVTVMFGCATDSGSSGGHDGSSQSRSCH
jgi:hypothetical protein